MWIRNRKGNHRGLNPDDFFGYGSYFYNSRYTESEKYWGLLTNEYLRTIKRKS